MCSILACLDGYMNIAMEQTEEYVNGQLKNKYSIAFILGNDGTLKDDLLFYCYYSNFLFFCPISMIGLSPFMQFSMLVHQRGHWQMGLSFDVYQVI